MAGRKPKTHIKNKVKESRAAGMTMAEIAKKLGISVQLVSYHSKSLTSKKQ